jgi:hypothetical protein
MKRMQKAILAATLTAAATAAGGEDLEMRKNADFRWVCGGVGAEERAALAKLRPEANLELLFVTEKRGGYLADAEVALLPLDRPRAALKLVADGPMCLIFAPAGPASSAPLRRCLPARPAPPPASCSASRASPGTASGRATRKSSRRGDAAQHSGEAAAV